MTGSPTEQRSRVTARGGYELSADNVGTPSDHYDTVAQLPASLSICPINGGDETRQHRERSNIGLLYRDQFVCKSLACGNSLRSMLPEKRRKRDEWNWPHNDDRWYIVRPRDWLTYFDKFVTGII